MPRTYFNWLVRTAAAAHYTHSHIHTHQHINTHTQTSKACAKSINWKKARKKSVSTTFQAMQTNKQSEWERDGERERRREGDSRRKDTRVFAQRVWCLLMMLHLLLTWNDFGRVEVTTQRLNARLHQMATATVSVSASVSIAVSVSVSVHTCEFNWKIVCCIRAVSVCVLFL